MEKPIVRSKPIRLPEPCVYIFEPNGLYIYADDSKNSFRSWMVWDYKDAEWLNCALPYEYTSEQRMLTYDELMQVLKKHVDFPDDDIKTLPLSDKDKQIEELKEKAIKWESEYYALLRKHSELLEKYIQAINPWKNGSTNN